MPNILRGEKNEAQSGIRSSGGVPILDETYNYLVQAESLTTSRLSVLGTAGIPQVGITITSGGAAVCRTVNAVRRADQRLLWDVTATFSSEVDERQSVQAVSGDPTLWVPIYETKFERLQEIATKDAAGTAIANSAGQPFENGIIRARFIPIWEFFQLEAASVTDEQVIDRNETVNDATFKGRATKTLLCTVLSSVVGFYYGARRRLTRYSLRYNVNTWTHKRLDVGTVYLDGGSHKAYLDDDGNVMLGGLDGTGAKVAIGSPPSTLEFDMYPTATFSSFLRI
jgi:hypothetical protein